MNELIRIEKQRFGENQINSVNARELFEFLKVKSRYNDWIKNRIEKYGFEENLDFISLTKNLVSGGKLIEHYISIDMAKELSMVENNEMGRMARKYFIEVERQWMNKSNLPMDYKQALEHLLEQVKENERLQSVIDNQKPLVEFSNTVSDTENLSDIKTVAKSLDIGPLKLFEFLRDQKVLMDGVHRNIPYQKYLNLGWFKVITKTRKLDNGDKERYYQTKVYGKGIQGIFNLWKEYEGDGMLRFN